MLQSEAQEKARLIRNCDHCRGTWREDAEGDVERCTCFKGWKTAMIDLRSALKDAKEKREDWETDDMFDHHSVNRGSLEGLVAPEKFKTLRLIRNGNLFTGLEPPYMPHFNRIHRERTQKGATERW